MDHQRTGSLSGLTEAEAKEFHKLFVVSFVGFTLLAAIAHFIVWNIEPWGVPNSPFVAASSSIHSASPALLTLQG
ncbi:MAG: light-harvesting protein [Hyphomonadaceae bacterium]|nr:light-harvesting protein [Hyphomonadaceae bacterium]